MKRFLSYFLIAILVGTMGTAMPATTVIASSSTLTKLQQQQAAAEAAAKKAAEEAARQKQRADLAAKKSAEITEQIGEIEGNLETTQKNIASTQVEVEGRTQAVAKLDSSLRRLSDQQNALIKTLYVMTLSLSDTTMAFSNQSYSERERQVAQLNALRSSVAVVATETTLQRTTTEKERQDLIAKQQQLESLRNQQTEQRRALGVFKNAQVQLRQNALVAAEQLESEAEAQKKKAAQIEAQVTAELSKILAAQRKSGSFAGGGPGTGARVSAGQYLGTVGCSGFCTGPHVHFELRNPSGVVIDPTPFIGTMLRWPITPVRITQTFGMTAFARSGAYNGNIHTGVDLGAPFGTPVYAPASGILILNRYYGGYGNARAIALDNGYVVLVTHLQQ
jgi:septal ring factor EnvC (AmiA/AmiB activator)